jgi:hypothetical protein
LIWHKLNRGSFRSCSLPVRNNQETENRHKVVAMAPLLKLATGLILRSPRCF